MAGDEGDEEKLGCLKGRFQAELNALRLESQPAPRCISQADVDCFMRRAALERGE